LEIWSTINHPSVFHPSNIPVFLYSITTTPSLHYSILPFFHLSITRLTLPHFCPKTKP
jgi:hypothetical protein